MADAVSIIPAAVLRSITDKLYEKRKVAALEVELIVKNLCGAGDHDRVTSVIDLLTTDFTNSLQSNHRKGGLIGLAAVTVGLAGEAHRHLDRIVPPVILSFHDQDSNVRYYACEALYNIAKVVRGEFIEFFNQIFDALCKLSADSDVSVQSAAHLLDRLVKDIVTESDQFSIEEFIPLLRGRMNVLNPHVRQFLVGWITVLDSVPEIDMLGFLPDFLDGLFNMLSDSSIEIRQQADSALVEFLEEIKNSPNVDYGRMAEILVARATYKDDFTRMEAIVWIHEFVKLGGDQLVPHYDSILGALLPCISDKDENIKKLARETNEVLRCICAKSAGIFDVGSVLEVAKRSLSSEWEETRIETLHWMRTLFSKCYNEKPHKSCGVFVSAFGEAGFSKSPYNVQTTLRYFPSPRVIVFMSDIFESLLAVLSDSSHQVVLLVLDVLACIARDDQYFHNLVIYLIHSFRNNYSLLEKRGALIIRRLCVLLNSEKIYREFSLILEGESDYNFASTMVQALNLILLTSSELADMRTLLRHSPLYSSGKESKDLFLSLYSSWCHCPMATISLCLLTQAYHHASSVIQSLGEDDINVKFLVQLDKLVLLLETPIFAFLRLQLLEPRQYPWLLKSLYGLLMLLPQQSSAFKILRTRLKALPSYSFTDEDKRPPSRTSSYPQILQLNEGINIENIHNGINFKSKLRYFEQVRRQHRNWIQANTQLHPHVLQEEDKR